MHTQVIHNDKNGVPSHHLYITTVLIPTQEIMVYIIQAPLFFLSGLRTLSFKGSLQTFPGFFGCHNHACAPLGDLTIFVVNHGYNQ